MLESYDVNIIFLIYGQFGANRKPHYGYVVYKTYIFINSNLYLTKPANRTKISLTKSSHYCFERYFLPKNTDFLQENADISKIKTALVLRGISSEITYLCVLTCQI